MSITRKSWYENINVQFELIHQQKWRETFFLPYLWDDRKNKFVSTPPVRWMNCSAIKFLKMNWERYGFLDKNMNLYFSLATYKNFPTFSWNWRVKSQQQAIWLTEFKNYIKAYDLFIETDSDDLKDSFREAVEIKDFLLKYDIKFCCGMSGSKGVHFIVQSEEFDFLNLKDYDEFLEEDVNKKDFNSLFTKLPIHIKELDKVFDKVILFKMLNLRLKTLLSCDTIDTSISDLKRVKKTFYSWDVKSGYIALPLTDEQLNNFNVDMVKPETVMKSGIYKRGLLYRNLDIPLKKRNDGIKKMFGDLGIIKW